MKTLTIRMKADDVVEVLLYDVIGGDFFSEGINAKDFNDQLKGIKAKVINLRINSPGGSVFEAAAMVAGLDRHKARIEVDVDGLAASAASVVAMAGDEIRVSSGGMMMVHNPWGMVMGHAEDMRATAETLDKVKDTLLDIYTRRPKVGREQAAAWMDAETWFTGKEAVEAGMADEVTDAPAIAACANLEKVAAKLGFKHVPESLTAPPPAEVAAWGETRRRREIAASL